MDAGKLQQALEVKSKLDSVRVELINLERLEENARGNAYLYPLQVHAKVVGEEFYTWMVELLRDHLKEKQDQLQTEFEQL